MFIARKEGRKKEKIRKRKGNYSRGFLVFPVSHSLAVPSLEEVRMRFGSTGSQSNPVMSCKCAWTTELGAFGFLESHTQSSPPWLERRVTASCRLQRTSCAEPVQPQKERGAVRGGVLTSHT